MQLKTRPVGVFDSGMGGLTVLSALRQKMPHESFIYLGDTARLPYGTKSKDTVKQYAAQMVRILVERDIKTLVIACNTATTAALTYLQNLLPQIPIMGVVAPGARAAIQATKNQKVMVLATETTVASNAYQHLIQEALPKASIEARASGLLVALAEEGMVDNDIAKAALLHYLSGLSDEDTLLLGCTHFPVFKNALREILDASVQVVDSAEAAAVDALQLLTVHQLLNDGEIPPRVHYLATDSIERFGQIGEHFLGEPLDKNTIELVDICP